MNPMPELHFDREAHEKMQATIRETISGIQALSDRQLRVFLRVLASRANAYGVETMDFRSVPYDHAAHFVIQVWNKVWSERKAIL